MYIKSDSAVESVCPLNYRQSHLPYDGMEIPVSAFCIALFLPGAGGRGEVPAGIHDHLHEMVAADLSVCSCESSWLISLLRSSISESSGRISVFSSPLVYIA